jgi:hypothetical protein
VRKYPVPGFLHSKLNSPLVAIILQLGAEPGFKSRINVNGIYFIMNGNAPKTFLQEPQKGQAVLSTGKPHCDTISIRDHVVVMNGFANPSVQRSE